MSEISYAHRHQDLVCDLGPDDAATRAAEWSDLHQEALTTEAVDGGSRLWLEPEVAQSAADLARREAMCCGFLDIDLRREGDLLRLDITSPVPGAQHLIALMIGTPPEPDTQCC
jgi:hypothetical protein